jgi:hypothetical protein
MHDAKQSVADLSAQERLCLLLIGDGGLEAFNPREDEVVASLLDMELASSSLASHQARMSAVSLSIRWLSITGRC